MSFPLFHAARVLNPNLFELDSFRTVSIKDGITAVIGKLKSQDNTSIQTYRFEKDKFNAEQAKQWLADYGIEVILFEPAIDRDGQGKGNKKQSDGGVSVCICPKCKFEIEHDRGTPCNDIKCPKCGAKIMPKILQASEVYQIDNEQANIYLYGVIGADEQIDCNHVAEMIHACPEEVKRINVHINSQGGSIINGGSLISALLNSKKEIHTYNDFAALSMGGLILMCGDKIHMSEIGTLMIHEPNINGKTADQVDDEAQKSALIAMQEQLVSIFVKRTGIERAEIEKIMKDTTYLNAVEAKAKGFIDEIIDIKPREAENATGVTSREADHFHNYSIDDIGNGRTTNTLPATHKTHTHQIEKFIVLPALNHIHKLARAKTGTSQETVTIQASLKLLNGSEWEVIVINEGYANMLAGKFYVSAEVLKNSVDCFNDVGVYCHAFGKTIDGNYNFRHRPLKLHNPNGLFGNKVGWIDNAKYDSSNGKGVVKSTFHCIDDAVRNKLVNIWNTNKSQMPQFSIDINCDTKRVNDSAYVEKFAPKATSLDMVTFGAFEDAGFERLAASLNKENKTMKKLLEKLLAKIKEGVMKLSDSIEGKSDEDILSAVKSSLGINDKELTLTDEQVEKYSALASIADIKNAIEEDEKTTEPAPSDPPVKPAPAEPAPAPAEGEGSVSKESFNKLEKQMQAMRMTTASNMVDRVLAEDGKLDTVTKGRIRKGFVGKVDVTEKMVQDEMIDHKKYIDRMTASGAVTGMGSIEVGENFEDKRTKRLECFVDPDLQNTKGYEGITSYQNIMQAMLDWTPEFRSFEYGKTMQAAATSTFPTLFQDVMNKQIRKQYEVGKQKSEWIKLVNEVSNETLDEQHIYDIGGFPFLDTVGEGDAYQELDNPSDMEATYTMAKRGGKFTITEEMMFTSGPKVTQLIRMFPKNMAAAANLTLSLFVFNKITGCDGSSGANTQTIYDGATLYNLRDGVNNFGTAALAYSSFYSGYTSMANRTKLNTSAPAEFRARHLLVPLELLPTAVNVVKGEVYPSQTSNGVQIKNPYAGLGVEPIGVPNYYLCSDTNNWYLIADKNGFPTLQIGYFQNQRVPQLLLQNTDTVGVPFTNDQWVYKTKFRFGGAITDHRGFYAGIVT